ncbi:MAG: DUF2892 domain-containing protein [Candidatus Saccharibacteria bacterium]
MASYAVELVNDTGVLAHITIGVRANCIRGDCVEHSVKHNLGTVDRLIRAGVGLIAFLIAAIKPIPMKEIWVIVLWAAGVFLIAEAATGY